MKIRSSRRPRPPPLPSALSPTWRHVARRAVGDDVDVLRAALLAAEARRRRRLVYRERRAIKDGVAPAHRVRMRALERELRSWAKGVEHYKVVSLIAANKPVASKV